MQVRYQAALRPANLLRARLEAAGIITDSCRYENNNEMMCSGTQDVEHIFQLDDHLPDQLVIMGGLLAIGTFGELLARTTDGVTLIVQQAADLADHQHVLALVVAPVAAPLH